MHQRIARQIAGLEIVERYGVHVGGEGRRCLRVGVLQPGHGIYQQKLHRRVVLRHGGGNIGIRSAGKHHHARAVADGLGNKRAMRGFVGRVCNVVRFGGIFESPEANFCTPCQICLL